MTTRTIHHPDVLVVGDGVLGLTITREVARSGRSVLCVGRGAHTPGTASTAAGAMLGAIGEVTASDDPAAEVELAFRVRSADLWRRWLPELIDELGATVPHGSGTVMFATLVNHRDRDNLAAARSAAQRVGAPTESLDPRDVPGLRPARGHEAVEALFLPEEGHVDSGALLDGLARSIRAMTHADLLEATVTGVHAGGHPSVDLSDGQRIEAGVVVLAAGVGCADLLPPEARGGGAEAGGVAPLLPGKGVSMVLTDLPTEFPYVLRTPNRDFACGTHVVPRPDGRLYLGATNRVSSTPGVVGGVTPGELHALLHSGLHELHVGLRTSTVAEVRHGLRPLTLDGAPLLGPTAAEGVWIATGTYRNGILMAPHMAALLVEELGSGSPSPENPYRPVDRLRPRQIDLAGVGGGASAEGERAFREGLRHLASFVLEPGGSLPYDRQRELMAFIEHLGVLAVRGPGDPDRDRLIAMLEAAPMAEVAPQLFYEVATAALTTS